MGWRYRKRIKIFPGFHINVSKSGIGANIGVKGASATFFLHKQIEVCIIFF